MLDLSIIGAVIHLCHGCVAPAAAIDTGVIAYVYQSVPLEYEADYLTKKCPGVAITIIGNFGTKEHLSPSEGALAPVCLC